MSSLKAQLAFWPFKWGDGVHALHTSAVKNKSGAGPSLSCLWQCKLLHQDFLQDSLRLPGPQDLLHNPPRLSETPFLVYQKSSSLPLPLLGGITVIGYWTRSSLPRARLSIGDRFTSEKPLLDGPLHRDTAIPGYCNTTPHYTSLVLAFHWWGIYPSLGSAIKMLLTGKFSRLPPSSSFWNRVESTLSFYSKRLSLSLFEFRISHESDWLSFTKLPNKPLRCLYLFSTNNIIIPSTNLWVSQTISSPIYDVR